MLFVVFSREECLKILIKGLVISLCYVEIFLNMFYVSSHKDKTEV